MTETASLRRRAHHNRQLFSNHFLDHRLPDDEIWGEVADDAEKSRQELRRLYEAEGEALAEANEAQTEERWIKPVLRALGWGFEVQPVSRRQGTVQFPDYALFPSQDEADQAASQEEQRRILKDAVAVGEAKRWNRSLDAGDADDEKLPNRVPSAQIINYLIRAEQPWGILTNGVEWRLYYRDADFADTVFFSVDLPSLLADEALVIGPDERSIDSEEAFRYFYLFFRPEAFVLHPDGRRWLDLLRESSARYARAVEEELKPRAYRAVTALCRGLVQARGVELEELDEEEARQVLDDALTILFRLLFILHAEARDLLPLRTNPAYRSKSLFQLRERVAEIREGDGAVFSQGDDLWHDLHDLFQIIDGHPRWRDANVPVYNGGLFDPARHPRVEEGYVPDPEMSEALDLLSRTRDPDDDRLHFVDYGPLDVRHLGSIYEGLLEHQVRVADEDLPAIHEKGKRVRDPVKKGHVYLANDRGERRVTGSFYTPDYVVQYIVEETLGPLTEDRTPEEILELKVVDPAMGSGHFLVAATSYLARAAVRSVEEGPQPVLGEFAKLDPEKLRRLVVERCIFGVDKNPRAVELAKLSLWLATVERDKPLNFLDHHLRAGDSLVGARIRRLGGVPGRSGKAAKLEEAGQFNTFDSAFRQQLLKILAYVREIETLPSDTLDEVKQKEKHFREADTMLERFREVANLWISRLFGNEFSGDDYARVLEALPGPRDWWEKIEPEDWLERSRELQEEHRFFHWQVEFGEVFFDEDGRTRDNPGFDAVIGNPPYVRMEEFKELKEFLKHEYETHDTRSDLYVYFVEKALELLRDDGQFGMILSNKFLRAKYGRKLRRYIGDNAGVREIVDFGGLPVFPEATVRAAIVIAERDGSSANARYTKVGSLNFSDLGAVAATEGYAVPSAALQASEWRLVSEPVFEVLQALSEVSGLLGEHLNGPIGYGVKTGLNEAFFLTSKERAALLEKDPRLEALIKPLVRGHQVRRYYLETEESWLLYLDRSIRIEDYPAIEEYLSEWRGRLKERAASQEWFQLQQPQPGYFEHYEQPKILYPVIGRGPRFSVDSSGLFPNDKCYFLPSNDGALLAILNSHIAFFSLRLGVAQLEGPGDDPYLEFRTQYMERLPIRRIPKTTPEHTRTELADWLKSLYHRGLRAAGITPEIPDDIREIGPRLGDLPGVERVLLVGSWARGDADQDSDVDLIVVQDENGSAPERHAAIRRTLEGLDRPLDLILYTPADYERARKEEKTFAAHLEGEAVPLYGHES